MRPPEPDRRVCRVLARLYVCWRLPDANCDWEFEMAVARAYKAETPKRIRDAFMSVPVELPLDACLPKEQSSRIAQDQIQKWNRARQREGLLEPIGLGGDGTATECVYYMIDSRMVCHEVFDLELAQQPWTVPHPEDAKRAALLRLALAMEIPLPG
ncbi:MAG TPA: hypothetical protein VJP77_06505 [Planctomycetota bacterium]|nr:hypothetical protein [Planctomycetota bacterium]